ncbi:HigA family addiction module antitoxin [Chimaeribacter arupi]|nr:MULTISPECIES: HigA family addiction module antitoxin [Yersiniaceae]MBS0968186.1 HigA family addiction module antidote protein [Nissabacter archeti]MDV5139385.1 HigA family addiction module antitoxin [Chimaeribacter arupi]WKZ91591.1 HigA family addiction module antitoxin [Chimaeribacter arupi]
MNMYNPPHPGHLVRETMEELGLSARQLALALDVAPTTLQRLVNCQSDISSEMAIRLAEVIGSSPEVWLSLQCKYDLWQARNRVDVSRLHRLTA